MSNTHRRLNLNVGINTTGYLPNAWKYRTGTKHDINDIDYYRRLTEIETEARSVLDQQRDPITPLSMKCDHRTRCRLRAQ